MRVESKSSTFCTYNTRIPSKHWITENLMEFIGEGSVDQILEAQTHVWNHLYKHVNFICVKCAVQLGIPDILHDHGKAMSLSELVGALPIHQSKAQYVHRLMCVLVQSGFISVQKGSDHVDQECYSLTPASHLLLKDSPWSMRPMILMVLDPAMSMPWYYLDSWFQSNDPAPFNTAHGKTLWEYAGKDSRLNNVFNEAMASDSFSVSCVLLSKCKGAFEGVKTLVDVGGGTGAMARNIADALPNLEYIVLDLPHVVADLEDSKNLKFLGGDMFESIPPADAVLLKWILHDWSDEDCVKILAKCKEAIVKRGGQGGKVMIIEIVMGNQNMDQKSTQAQLFLDMEMMVTAGSQERTEKEWAKLFFDAGFSNYKINQVLGFRALIEVYP